MRDFCGPPQKSGKSATPWPVPVTHGSTLYQLHLLLDKHATEQLALIDCCRLTIDSLAERVQTLGGMAVADLRHVAEITCIARPPDGRQQFSVTAVRGGWHRQGG